MCMCVVVRVHVSVRGGECAWWCECMCVVQVHVCGASACAWRDSACMCVCVVVQVHVCGASVSSCCHCRRASFDPHHRGAIVSCHHYHRDCQLPPPPLLDTQKDTVRRRRNEIVSLRDRAPRRRTESAQRQEQSTARNRVRLESHTTTARSKTVLALDPAEPNRAVRM